MIDFSDRPVDAGGVFQNSIAGIEAFGHFRFGCNQFLNYRRRFWAKSARAGSRSHSAGVFGMPDCEPLPP
jgi:hypothetical protein